MSFDKCILFIYLFIYLFYLCIYLNLCTGTVVGASIPLTNIWRELGMLILLELLKSQIKIKQIIIIIK